MKVVNLAHDARPFTTKDGSTIRELMHPEAQSLAEATLAPGQATQRHYRGLLPQQIAWSAYSGHGGLTIYGLAGNQVASIEVRWPGGHRATGLTANVFSVTRPFEAKSIRALPLLGRLVVRYRDGRPPATVELR